MMEKPQTWTNIYLCAFSLTDTGTFWSDAKLYENK